MARPAAGRGLAGEQPRSCRASGAAAVTVRPRSRPRARERCRARSSPSPARLAASALSSWGAAAAATAALEPAQLRSPRASCPPGSVQRTGARHPLPHRLPASRDVSTSCRTEHVTKHAFSARKMSARTARGSARSLSLGRRVLTVVATASYLLQGLRIDLSLQRPGLNPLRGGFGETGVELPLQKGRERTLCSVDSRDPVRAREHLP